MLIPWGPKAGPTGGAGVALPAGAAVTVLGAVQGIAPIAIAGGIVAGVGLIGAIIGGVKRKRYKDAVRNKYGLAFAPTVGTVRGAGVVGRF